MRRKVLKWFGLTCLAVVFLGAGAVGALLWHFYPSPPAAPEGKPANPLAAQRQDLGYFRQLLALDRAFTPAARAAAELRITALEQLTVPLDPAHLRVALMQITALADNGHSRLGYDTGAEPDELPVRVALFADELYVMRASDEAADLLGGRVIEVDGRPIEEVMSRLETLRGGTRAWRRAYASMYLPWQDVLHGLDIAAGMQQSTWTVITPAGATAKRTLTARRLTEVQSRTFVKRWISSEPLAAFNEGWQAYAPAALPLALQQFDQPFRVESLPGSCALYVQYKSNDDQAGQSISEFSRKVREALQAHPPCALVMDLRYNDGGNYLKTAGFMRHLPDYLPAAARIYLLTGPLTYSAGLVSTAFIKQAAGARVTVLGEPPGDRAAFYSEGQLGCLPNYPLCVAYATGKHDYQQPCTDLEDCFWPNYLFPTRIRSLDPDETIVLTFADWRAGRDPVVERALQLIGAAAPGGQAR